MQTNPASAARRHVQIWRGQSGRPERRSPLRATDYGMQERSSRWAVASPGGESEQQTTGVDQVLRHRVDDGQDDQSPQEPTLVPMGSDAASTPVWGGGLIPNKMVQLLVHLTNPTSRLKTVLEAFPDGLPRRVAGPVVPQPVMRRLGNGEVKRAVVRVLAAPGGPLKRAEIQAAVVELLGQQVSEDSVYWCLYAGLRGPQPLFERVTYGHYRLSQPT
jgi:hypothetical protein